MLVPYKRHEAATIERIIEDPAVSDAAVDESTIRRIRNWFEWWGSYAAGCLESIAHRIMQPVVESSSALPQTALQRIGRLVGDAVGWLARVVRPIANTHLWTQTRSVFLS